ncbi:glutamine--fructose-6-phosphate transaminase (isomerizing) [Caldisalinibacter kiritimatiensis]|uniref:Glutamine--fructose-6-phosphate aminotransferase [isomerizing] n=1 Tax=Caldisalinibacter kiritimatiensis TaxID=1304284 RepID=R1AW26_9FIRM|nr:glutamine--fructose-6-phosphate transaminase (isomerizing) [Caldisalinibacter kiritimatiensis]EOD00842.1 Glucosamine--fructose-6-phosphate aminotransferase [Caldisalinibacter kiritimatiensis]
MCGIVGYIGNRNVAEILIEGLEKLEYRGYDSAGIAVLGNDEVKVKKYKGRLSVLRENIQNEDINGTIGIGHTRWATHGEPSDVNSHPHTNSTGSIAVVHNGIIENYMKIKQQLQEKGYKFVSETDTEVISHLIDYHFEGDLVEAVKKAVADLEGAYALGVINKDNPDRLVAVRKDSPLIVGVGEGENFIASDIPAILKHTRKVYILEDGEMAILEKDKIELMKTDGTPIKKDVYVVNWDVEAAEKGGYDHFMLKEIYEQPKAIRDTLSPRVNNENEIRLDDISITKEELDRINRVYIIACGTAYHAGLLGKILIEKYVNVPVIADVASEFRYGNTFIDENTLMIVVSQSGETADTLAALRLAKEKGARVIAVTNVVGSTISREADDVFYTWAGPEIAVASTKAYTTQLVSLALIAMQMATIKGTITEEDYSGILNGLNKLSKQVKSLLEKEDLVKEAAKEIYNAEHIFYIGRGIDYDVAREGALKLKEISYIHCEAMPAGELKHGTIALIEEGTPVIAVATQEHLYEKMVSNIKEVKARGAYVIALAKEGNEDIEETADSVIYIPEVIDELTSVLNVIPLQLLAYYVAVMRGCDVDKPRNLAKSVTVE